MTKLSQILRTKVNTLLMITKMTFLPRKTKTEQNIECFDSIVSKLKNEMHYINLKKILLQIASFNLKLQPIKNFVNNNTAFCKFFNKIIYKF